MFDRNADPGELNNLAAVHGEIQSDIEVILERHLTEALQAINAPDDVLQRLGLRTLQ
jgi:hypothetical protein